MRLESEVIAEAEEIQVGDPGSIQGTTHYADEMDEEDEVVQVQTREKTQNPVDTAAGEPQKISAAPDREDAQLELQEQDTEVLNGTAQVAELEPHNLIETDTVGQIRYPSRSHKEPDCYGCFIKH